MSSFPLPALTPIAGPATVNDGAVFRGPRLDRKGSTVTADSLGVFYEETYRGNLFFACNTASQALSLNSTTFTGLALTNPASSGKYLILIQLNVALLTAPAGISSLILSGNLTTPITTHTTPMTVQPGLIGRAASAVGLVDSAATTPALTILRPVGGGPVATGSVTAPFIQDNINGQIVLAPGTFIGLQCLTTAISVIASLSWIEVATT